MNLPSRNTQSECSDPLLAPVHLNKVCSVYAATELALSTPTSGRTGSEASKIRMANLRDLRTAQASRNSQDRDIKATRENRAVLASVSEARRSVEIKVN